VADSKSLDGLTFSPDLSPSRVRVGAESYDKVEPRISMGPGAAGLPGLPGAEAAGYGAHAGGWRG